MAANSHELIICIVNNGFSDTVMDAAKDAGARGGTVLNARGTANKEAESFFHIAIQPEKEVVMILVPLIEHIGCRVARALRKGWPRYDGAGDCILAPGR